MLVVLLQIELLLPCQGLSWISEERSTLRLRILEVLVLLQDHLLLLLLVLLMMLLLIEMLLKVRLSVVDDV